MTPLYLSGALRKLEADHTGDNPSLMALAGAAIADWLLERYRGCRFGLLIGPGNNGGDALVSTRHLLDAGQAVHCIVPRQRSSGSPQDAALLATPGLQVSRTAELADCDVIVDGLFGLGLRTLDQSMIDWLLSVDALGKPVIAIDVPSGLDADRGIPKPYALRATHTLSMLGLKPGYYTAEGRDFCGEIHDFALLPHTAPRPAADAQLIDGRPSCTQLVRRHASHKGTHGTLAIFGGSTGMTGAALLAGRMAVRAGAGKVQLGVLDQTLGVDPLQPELMIRSATELQADPGLDLAVIGPGLGQSAAASSLLEHLLKSTLPLLLDADALNLVAAKPETRQLLRERTAPSLITPHPAEAGRLLGLSTQSIQIDRLDAAKRLGEQLNTSVLLKGSGTICADAAGLSINASGNGALGSAGQGDLLSGLIAALWVQGMPAIDAARLGAFVHGQAADEWRASNPNGLGLCASELIDPIRHLLNQ
ncbi:NAD(P)H-hydrate dehydratase [Jeongeupia chitinilytica]|uniref:ADP-dependent (S)-NAD(P)H-hydrate dehydratase n=1 Tax=Jeongeupia chitinilytica TaxID=1041641 RepID=A0ABQ3H3Z8_9NEIS|nr:NAD(P)H-hydrate dehydratase [Jeongeupia chitinilytica]GHD66331.1 bifunctional NAD(P)H-hydrate repair enzyme [Jeongeupia chitinilytica]